VPRAALSDDEVRSFRQRATGAAMHLFAEQGYDGVTMRALAAALDVSAMTPYRYFAGKEALFALVRAEAFRRFADVLQGALDRRADPLERLRRLKRAYIGFALDERDAYRIMFELRQPDPADHPELVAESRRAFGVLHRTVAEAVAAGQLAGDPLRLAYVMWADTHGLVSLHLAGKLGSRTLKEVAAIDHELIAFSRRKR
jgi:AcrR family transcriptional regulator